jgi:hypothetical protein
MLTKGGGQNLLAVDTLVRQVSFFALHLSAIGAFPVFAGGNNFVATGAFKGKLPEQQIKKARSNQKGSG